MAEPLAMWVVYDHPLDFPSNFVAREFLITESGSRATGKFILSPRMEDIRQMMMDYMLSPLARDPSDEPHIVESWV